jgi:hypothetical protein
MSEFLVVQRMFNDADEVEDTFPWLWIKDVPHGIGIKQIKEVLEQAGFSYQWGLYTIVPEEEWMPIDSPFDQSDELALRTDRLNLTREVNYEELLDMLNDEKRVTLRLPVGLHVALAKEAKDMTLNSFCLKVLADAVGYGERLEEFEAQRRKPGRPKKDQDSE